jgi:hypothetical protein
VKKKPFHFSFNNYTLSRRPCCLLATVTPFVIFGTAERTAEGATAEGSISAADGSTDGSTSAAEGFIEGSTGAAAKGSTTDGFIEGSTGATGATDGLLDGTVTGFSSATTDTTGLLETATGLLETATGLLETAIGLLDIGAIGEELESESDMIGLTTSLAEGLTTSLEEGLTTSLAEGLTTSLEEGLTTSLVEGLTTAIGDTLELEFELSMTDALCIGLELFFLTDATAFLLTDFFVLTGLSTGFITGFSTSFITGFLEAGSESESESELTIGALDTTVDFFGPAFTRVGDGESLSCGRFIGTCVSRFLIRVIRGLGTDTATTCSICCGCAFGNGTSSTAARRGSGFTGALRRNFTEIVFVALGNNARGTVSSPSFSINNPI